MVREVFEETGLNVRSTGVVDVDSSLLTDDLGNAFHGIRIIYNTQLLGGRRRNEADGSTDECAWFALAEAKDLQLVGLAKRGLALAFGPIGRLIEPAMADAFIGNAIAKVCGWVWGRRCLLR